MSAATLAQLDQFDDIIDVRTPSEFLDDHVPGAINRPVLSDEERVRVGTMYKQESSFAAKKTGAALVARNIADHLEVHFSDKPKDWHPLVYCWRGGNRSGSLVHILAKIGWKAEQLDGGYKAYRRAVLEQLETLPARFHYRVICGPTGSAKSGLLQALERQGAQVLDLEGLAVHRGSILGSVPDQAQPSQKLFESQLWQRLRRFNPERPVFVEAESKKIGNVRAPDTLLAAMWQSECVRIDASPAARLAYLKQEYRHFLEQPELLIGKFDFLVGLHGHERIARWKALALAHDWDTLVPELLAQHYDPAYSRSTHKHYPRLEHGIRLSVDDLAAETLDEMARRILAP
ncbi:MAG: tRNA 2-selenouridine(34) synthase MnmH [Burkholderiales bacterium]